MTTRVIFCILYDSFRWDFQLQKEYYFNKKKVYDTVVVSDGRCMRLNVITRMIIWFL